MAGSKRDYVYQADDGTQFAVKLDKSNTDELNGGENVYPQTGGPKYRLPKNLKPREIAYSSQDGLRVIRIIALTPTIYSGALANKPTIQDPIVPSQTLRISRQTPERIRDLPKPVDTAQTNP